MEGRNIDMPKRKRKEKPTDDFYSVGVGKIDQQTPTTQMVYSIMQKIYDLFASSISTSNNFSGTELTHTCDLRTAYAHQRIVPQTNQFLVRSAFIGGAIHGTIEKILNTKLNASLDGDLNMRELQLNNQTIKIISEQTFRWNPFKRCLTNENDPEGIVVKPDLIFSVDGGKKWTVVDFKVQFGNKLNLKFEHRRQLLIYVYVLRQIGFDVEHAVLLFLPLRFTALKIIPIQITFTEHEIKKVEEEIKTRIIAINMSMKTEVLPLRHYGWWCKTCPYKRYCDKNIHPRDVKSAKIDDNKKEINEEWVGESSTI